MVDTSLASFLRSARSLHLKLKAAALGLTSDLVVLQAPFSLYNMIILVSNKKEGKQNINPYISLQTSLLHEFLWIQF